MSRKPHRKKPAKKTQAQYAEQYGVDVRTIRRWGKKGYPLDDPEEVARLEASQKNSRHAEEATAAVEIDAAKLTDEQLQNPPDLAHAKLYQLVLTCRRLAFANARERGDYLSRSECQADMVRIGSAVRNRLLALEGEMPGLLVGKAEHEIQKALHKWTVDTLTEFSDSASKLYA